jgi:hypothetical protein
MATRAIEINPEEVAVECYQCKVQELIADVKAFPAMSMYNASKAAVRSSPGPMTCETAASE